ncbi:uncharacterized protein LOC105182261 [Harpegnathos saltator]|nr:uncharacterized protein LOC105182261 [Harpegnathos saltator]
MKRIVAFAQVLSLVCLIALAFPQNDRSNGISGNSNNPASSTTQATTSNCPCIATAEYNPVCGSDNVTYWNMGRFNCAKSCNPQLEIRVIRACEPYSQISSN